MPSLPTCNIKPESGSSDRVEHSTQNDSSSDDDSEEDNKFSYIESLIRGVPMMPKGLTTSKPKKKSANVIIPAGYRKGDVKDVLRIGSPSTNRKKRDGSKFKRVSEVRKSPSVPT